MMGYKHKRGASRKPIRTARQPVSWRETMRHSVLVVALILSVSAALYLRQDDTLPILHVTVEGDFSHVDKNAFVAAVSPFARGSFMSVNVAQIRSAAEALPWVKQIQIRRIWPDSLHFIVEEQSAVAQWGDEHLLNEEGIIFSPPKATFPDNLVKLVGPDTSHQLMTKRFQAINTQLTNNNLAMTSLTMDERRSWSINLSNGITVRLGRTDSLKRFERFLRVYQRGLQHYESVIAEMDMRYTNGISVSWKQNQKPDFNGAV